MFLKVLKVIEVIRALKNRNGVCIDCTQMVNSILQMPVSGAVKDQSDTTGQKINGEIQIITKESQNFSNGS